jgi:hypothetical protein
MRFAALLAMLSADAQLKELSPITARWGWLLLGLVTNFMANGALQPMV